MTRRWLAVAIVLALASAAAARPALTRRSTAIKSRDAGKLAAKPRDPKKLGANARVAFGRGELRTPSEVIGRRAEPLTAEEHTAASIQKLLRGPLRNGVTGLFVADARTGEPLFAVNAEDPLNPASNVKLISTATTLELLGPSFRYPTRLLGPEPIAGVVRGDVYLLGSHDPTLVTADLEELADDLVARGVTAIDGDLVVGSDPTRDGLYRAIIPIEITAGEPGQPPTATAPDGFDLVTIKVTAKTSKRAHKPRLTYRTEQLTVDGKPHIVLTIGGTLGKDGRVDYQLWTRLRTATAAYKLRAALHARAIAFTGELATAELGAFIGDAITAGALPVELARHDSAPITDIIADVNKWSVNWLSDRLVMTAAGLARHRPPSMELAVEAMYGWLARHPHVAASDVVLDTGSGLSYRTRITPRELVSVVRSAGGYTGDADPTVARAWLDSLSIAGSDGTLRYRLRGLDPRGRILGKTGTLSNVIALSGILDLDPQRPLAFALITNTDAPLSKPFVRRAHDLVIGELCRYLASTTKLAPADAAAAAAAAAAPPAGPPAPAAVSEDIEPPPAERALDAEAAGQQP